MRADESLLPLTAAKQKTILALLLLHRGEVVSVDRLQEALWAELPPVTAATALQGYVSNLRRLLERGEEGGGSLLVTRSPGYLLAAALEQVDLAHFEQLAASGREALAAGEQVRAAGLLAEALALWRGPPLADFTYEPWAQGAIARLEELRLAALEERIEADLAVGRENELVGELETLIREHPLRERIRGQLMLALYRAGRQAEALEAYQDARRALVDELGIDPTPALQQLEKRILTQDSSLQLAPAGAERAAPPARPAPPERSILVATRDRKDLRDLLPLAELLARTKDAHELLLTQLVDPTSDGGRSPDLLAAATAELDEERRALAESGTKSRIAVFTSTDPSDDLVRLSARPEVDLLLLAGDRSLLADGRLSDESRRLLAEAPSHVGLWVKRGRVDAAPIRAVAVPFGAAEHDWAAIEVAAWAASARDVDLHLIGTAGDSEAGRRDASRLLADAALLVQRASDVVPKPVLVPPGREGVIQASENADLLVVGLSERWQDEGLGVTRWALAKTARVPVLFVRRGLRPSGLAPAHSVTRYTWSVTGLGA